MMKSDRTLEMEGAIAAKTFFLISDFSNLNSLAIAPQLWALYEQTIIQLDQDMKYALVAIAALLLASFPAHANIQMRISQVEELYTLTVPDQDTTKSAYGGRLRRYDVHIAKMFEVTDHLCQTYSLQPESYFQWNYRAGGGKIDMGMFHIDCESAFGAFSMMEPGKPERTIIYRSSEGGIKDEIVMNVSTLKIIGDAKIRRWMLMTRNFKPIR